MILLNLSPIRLEESGLSDDFWARAFFVSMLIIVLSVRLYFKSRIKRRSESQNKAQG